MTPIKKPSVASSRVWTGTTLLALSFVAVGFMAVVGSWALAGVRTGDFTSTPTVAEAYGDQFLLTNNQVANPPVVQETSSSDSIVSPLTNWTYTARARRHVSPAN